MQIRLENACLSMMDYGSNNTFVASFLKPLDEVSHSVHKFMTREATYNCSLQLDGLIYSHKRTSLSSVYWTAFLG